MLHMSYRQQEAPDLFEWLCIEELRLCCPPGRFGPDCKGVKMIFTGGEMANVFFSFSLKVFRIN